VESQSARSHRERRESGDDGREESSDD